MQEKGRGVPGAALSWQLLAVPLLIRGAPVRVRLPVGSYLIPCVSWVIGPISGLKKVCERSES